MFVSLDPRLALPTGAQAVPPEPKVTVAVDSSRKELVITAGPFDLPTCRRWRIHAMMDLGMSHDTPIQRFEWPIDGWFRGFELELVDGQGGRCRAASSTT